MNLRGAGWTVLAVLLISAITRAAAGVSLADASQSTEVTSYRLEIPGSTIRTVAISPDAHFLAAGHIKSKNDEHQFEFATSISIWDLASRKWLTDKIVDSGTLPYSGSRYLTIAPEFLNYTSDGRRLVVFQGGAIRLFDPASLVEQSHIDLDDVPLHANGSDNARVWDVKVSPVENKVAVVIGGYPARTSGLLRIYDLITSRKTFERKIEAPLGLNVANMSFSPSGNRIAIVIRKPSGPELLVMDLESATVRALETNAWSAVFVDDNQLVTVQDWSTWMNRGKLRFYDVNSGKLVREIGGTPAGIHHRVEISGDKKILLGYIGKHKSVWDYGMEVVNQRFRIWELPSARVVADSEDILPLSPVDEAPNFRLSSDGKTVVALWSGDADYESMRKRRGLSRTLTQELRVFEIKRPETFAESPIPKKN